MAKPPAFVVSASFLVLLFGLAIAGCGGSMTNNSRLMQTLTVSPASADAKAFPGGQVQFTATATFNMAPMTVTSPPVLWSIGGPFASTPVSNTATVTANGLAQCNSFVGAVLVEATAPAEPEIPLLQMNATTVVVSGTAQLICP
jgi:hypothetical protein